MAAVAMLVLPVLARATVAPGQSCDVNVEVGLLTRDETLGLGDVTAAAMPRGTSDQIVVDWSMYEGADCVWIAVRPVERAQFPVQATVSMPASQRAAIVPVKGKAGTFCLELVAVSGARRGPPVERCVDVANPAPPDVEIELPVQPSSTPRAADPASTSWEWGWMIAGAAVGGVAAALALVALASRSGSKRGL